MKNEIFSENNPILVQKSGPLHGSVTVAGAKNSALKLMAACLLAPGKFTLHNVPAIADVKWMSELLEHMGASVTFNENQLDIEVPESLTPEAPYELVERMRASIVVLGPLLARFGQA